MLFKSLNICNTEPYSDIATRTLTCILPSNKTSVYQQATVSIISFDNYKVNCFVHFIFAAVYSICNGLYSFKCRRL